MLTESPEEISLRFERPKTVWFELDRRGTPVYLIIEIDRPEPSV
jgi:hypothetical protein